MTNILTALGAVLLGVFLMASPAHGADCDVVVDHTRDKPPWSVVRILVHDSETLGAPTASAICNPTTVGRDTPFDFMSCWVDESDSCTSWTLQIRHYPSQQSGDCQGACDPHVIATLDDTSNTEVRVTGPIGEGVDSNVTAISACTINVVCDFYRRQPGG